MPGSEASRGADCYSRHTWVSAQCSGEKAGTGHRYLPRAIRPSQFSGRDGASASQVGAGSAGESLNSTDLLVRYVQLASRQGT